MVPPVLILIAAAVSAAATALAGRFARWPPVPLVAAALGAFVLVIVWRLVCNALGLNEDFLPAVSVGDAGCLLAGGIPPAAVSAAVPRSPRTGVVILVGALAAFVVNVVIL